LNDKAIAERLQPSLLDRLTDDNAKELIERREDRVIDLRRLREIIQRDLSWLLNTVNAGEQIDESVYPNVGRSVLNFGLGQVAGGYSTAQRAELIRKSMLDAIQVFEPRIHPGSLDVELRVDVEKSQSIVSFDIRADMWAQPMPIELYLRSQVDMTTGKLELERVA
jgi:type VI secretion system protein ImpF|tara:strand:- start:483 stop:980 length:498 start_codon:yes stop_codon:yes gene_type:complete